WLASRMLHLHLWVSSGSGHNGHGHDKCDSLDPCPPERVPWNAHS
ncbi:hypothetical protein AWZ03_014891, partial [Drosophila navojoa]